MNNNRLLTPSQAAGILQVNERTISILAQSGEIPHATLPAVYGNEPQFRFTVESLAGWFKAAPKTAMNDEAYIARYRKRFQEQFPNEIAALKRLDKQIIPYRQPKGYTLTKVKSKKIGHVYYVRYVENGKIVTSRWSTHTNNREMAVKFALENRERLLAQYHNSKTPAKATADIYAVFGQYYEKDSRFLKIDAQRGRALGESARKVYHHTILNHWIPYLKKQKATSLGEIDTPMMARFQNWCLGKDIKPQTVNHYTSFVSQIFSHLLIEGLVKANPCVALTPLKVTQSSQEARGCYDITKLKGAFNKRWKDEQAYLLCLLIYATGMRNSEIERIQAKDLVRIENCRFVSISKSKTRYGIRLVPLHEFVYGKLAAHIRKTGKRENDYLFNNGKRITSAVYNNANRLLGIFAGHSEKKLAEENITFYSGRHYWKTLMNAHELGDVEEYFMGHRVSSDVARRYNHRDKQGQKMIARKALEAFKILDKNLFV